MKSKILITMMLVPVWMAFAQIPIRDRHITNQQERMVFKQWDRRKFTPRKGWLGLNPLYWLTWGLHPDYPKKDLRPLGPKGPQTQRLALVIAMQNTTDTYKLHSDTLRNTAISEAINYSSLFSDLDPLWLLYYRYQLYPLMVAGQVDEFAGLSEKEKSYLLRNGAYGWFLEETGILSERLNAARTTILDRGSRIIAYQRLLTEYRKLYSTWDTKKRNARQMLALNDAASKIRKKEFPLAGDYSKTDKQIADAILSKSKL